MTKYTDQPKLTQYQLLTAANLTFDTVIQALSLANKYAHVLDEENRAKTVLQLKEYDRIIANIEASVVKSNFTEAENAKLAKVKQLVAEAYRLLA